MKQNLVQYVYIYIYIYAFHELLIVNGQLNKAA